MRKFAVIRIGIGDFQNGFEVSFSIRRDSLSSTQETTSEITRRLPGNPRIENLYNRWRNNYLLLTAQTRSYPDFEFDEQIPEQTSTREEPISELWCQAARLLKEEMKLWLRSSQDGWQEIREALVGALADESDEIRVIIQSRNDILWRLPWHVWDLLDNSRYHRVEVALSPLDWHEPEPSNRQPHPKVRILALLGSDRHINLQNDVDEIDRTRRTAESVFLPQPNRNNFLTTLRDHKGWDILFFAGHGRTISGKGRIYISDNESLEVEEFKLALREAVRNGLKVAIFNSCDGLELAEALIGSSGISVVIAMRDQVPDQVAQKFLSEFLTHYAGGKALYAAVRQAREALEGLEGECPGATWLPAICQNLAAPSPLWRELHQPLRRLNTSNRFRSVMVASLAVTSLVLGIREIGLLQGWELKAFDYLLRYRPLKEKPDERLLIVTVTEEDLEGKGKNPEYSLSDQTVARLLDKLEQGKPRVIGLDIFRDIHLGSGRAELAKHFRDNPHLIAVCQVIPPEGNSSIAPPPEIPLALVGFSDLLVDPSDSTVRRQLLALKLPNDANCRTDNSLSLLLALHYLKQGGFPVIKNEEYLQIQDTIFKNLSSNSGGYRSLDNKGYQVLLSYRNSYQVAPKVSVSDVLNGDADALVRDRVVLIGVTAESFGDSFHTPYNRSMSGVEIHAHMVSQILSAVLDHRPLLWVLPWWGDIAWIGVWSIVGGVLVWRVQHLLHQGVAILIALAGLSGICFILLWQQGAWLPLVPSALVLVIPSGIVMIYTKSQAERSN